MAVDWAVFDASRFEQQCDVAIDVREADVLLILDAEAAEWAAPARFEGHVRRAPLGRGPIQCSMSGGRWDDGTFDALCTSTVADGAFAEMHLHLSKGQPAIPSRVVYRLFELDVTLAACVTVPDLDALTALGVKASTFGRLSFEERQGEYPRTQEAGEAAHVHGWDGLLVPSARSGHLNLVILCDVAGPGSVEETRDHGVIDWREGRKRPLGF